MEFSLGYCLGGVAGRHFLLLLWDQIYLPLFTFLSCIPFSTPNGVFVQAIVKTVLPVRDRDTF